MCIWIGLGFWCHTGDIWSWVIVQDWNRYFYQQRWQSYPWIFCNSPRIEFKRKSSCHSLRLSVSEAWRWSWWVPWEWTDSAVASRQWSWFWSANTTRPSMNSLLSSLSLCSFSEPHSHTAHKSSAVLLMTDSLSQLPLHWLWTGLAEGVCPLLTREPYWLWFVSCLLNTRILNCRHNIPYEWLTIVRKLWVEWSGICLVLVSLYLLSTELVYCNPWASICFLKHNFLSHTLVVISRWCSLQWFVHYNEL